MKAILFVIIKITAFPADLLVFRRKVHYENRHAQKRKLGKGCLIVSNHRSWWDYVVLMFVFFFRKVRPVVSYEIYHKNKVLTFFLDVIGAIPLGKVSWDPSYINNVVSELRKGHAVAIFPEAHFGKSDELMPFGNSYLRMAAEANVPILPFYTDGVYSFFHRNHVIIGEKYYLSNYQKAEGDKENVEALNQSVTSRVRALGEELNRRKCTSLVSPKFFFWDLGRFVVYSHFGFVYRVHVHDLMKYHRYHKLDGPFVLVANHTSFADPLINLIGFWRRRVHMLIAKEVYANKKLRSFGLDHLGGIKIDRSSLDINAINKGIEVLKQGRPLLVFGQGYIERSGNLTHFKEGPAMIASRANVPVICVYSLPRRYYQSHHLYVSPMLYPNGTSRKDVKELTQKMEDTLANLAEYAKEERENAKKRNRS